MHHSPDDASAANDADPWWPIIADQPVLTKLGFALIELALGQTLEDMKEDTRSYWGLGDRRIDDDSMNFSTAKRLLKSGKIREEATRDYEDAVKACISHQYPDKEGNNRSLLLKDDSFSDNARDAILSPLFHVWKQFE